MKTSSLLQVASAETFNNKHCVEDCVFMIVFITRRCENDCDFTKPEAAKS